LSKSIKENFEDLTTTAQGYIESSIAYYRLDFFKKFTKVAIDASHKLILAFFLLIALLFLSVAACLYIGKLLGSVSLGYIIVGVFYLIVMVIASLFLKPILRKLILSRASTSFFNDQKEVTINDITPTPKPTNELKDLH
jgi:Zn-dependent protease with chaperone function